MKFLFSSSTESSTFDISTAKFLRFFDICMATSHDDLISYVGRGESFEEMPVEMMEALDELLVLACPDDTDFDPILLEAIDVLLLTMSTFQGEEKESLNTIRADLADSEYVIFYEHPDKGGSTFDMVDEVEFTSMLDQTQSFDAALAEYKVSGATYGQA